MDAHVLRMLGQGTAQVLAARGRSLTLQRFGAALDDHRTSVYYGVVHDNPDALARELGLAHPGGAMVRDAAAIRSVREYMRRDMEQLGWDPRLVRCVDALDAVALRPLWQHPGAPRFRQLDPPLPLICIGDALHTVPPYTGAGGQLALADAGDLADVILAAHRAGQAAVSPADLHELERRLLKRLVPVLQRAGFTKAMLQRLTHLDSLRHMTLREVTGGSRIAAAVLWLMRALS